MLKRNVGGSGFSLVLFSLLLVVRVTAQGIPQGAASTDTGLGGVNTISGMIVSSTGERITRRVSVRLQSMTRGDRISTTDENGNFVFRGVPSGDYVVVIEKEKDFEPFSQTVSVIQPRAMPPQNYYLSIRLTSRPGITGTPGVINVDLAKVPKPTLAKYNKAIELAKNGDRRGAISQLQDAIAEYPEFALAYNEMGVQYMKLNELQKSDEALQEALKIDAHAYMPLMNRGIVLVMLKRYKDAEPLLREAVKLKSDQAVGHYFLGQTVANLGNFDEAEKELSAAIKLGGNEVKEAHRLLAIIYSSRGAKKDAIVELETYLRLAPTTPDAEQLRSVIRKLKGIDEPTPTSTKPSP
ncbi:MAG TPA: tetratricopeptide repeat protein [Pyrinomonadaceae bacterium]|nr:tetratricopeptide repeat protein [Pyrinomonadaceae bacterium]